MMTSQSSGMRARLLGVIALHSDTHVALGTTESVVVIYNMSQIEHHAEHRQQSLYKR